jgi:hypothetical protein
LTPAQAHERVVRQTRPREACVASRKAIAVAGLSAIAIAASGCGGDSDREAEFRAAFEKEFSAAPWIHHITGIKVKDGSLVLRTDLAPKRPVGGRDFDAVGVICGAAWGFAIEKEAIHHEGWVHVKDRDGVGILSCA